jgi:hypothetical protein
LSTWSQHRSVIARSLRDESGFRKLVDAYARMDELESGMNASRTIDEETDEATIEADSDDEKFLTAVEERLKARDQLFGESPDYEALLGGRPFLARWSLRSSRSGYV